MNNCFPVLTSYACCAASFCSGGGAVVPGGISLIVTEYDSLVAGGAWNCRVSLLQDTDRHRQTQTNPRTELRTAASFLLVHARNRVVLQDAIAVAGPLL